MDRWVQYIFRVDHNFSIPPIKSMIVLFDGEQETEPELN